MIPSRATPHEDCRGMGVSMPRLSAAHVSSRMHQSMTWLFGLNLSSFVSILALPQPDRGCENRLCLQDHLISVPGRILSDRSTPWICCNIRPYWVSSESDFLEVVVDILCRAFVNFLKCKTSFLEKVKGRPCGSMSRCPRSYHGSRVNPGRVKRIERAAWSHIFT